MGWLRGRRALTQGLIPRHIIQYPGNASFSEQLLGSRGDPLGHRQLVRRRKVAIASRHGNRLVARCFLNLFDRGSVHCQPGAECVSVRVSNVSVMPASSWDLTKLNLKWAVYADATRCSTAHLSADGIHLLQRQGIAHQNALFFAWAES
jgi:hypothetical protein